MRGEDNMVDLIDNLLGIEEKERDTFLVEKEVKRVFGLREVMGYAGSAEYGFTIRKSAYMCEGKLMLAAKKHVLFCLLMQSILIQWR